MNKRFFGILTITIFFFSALGIGALILFPSAWSAKKKKTEPQARIIIPQDIHDRFDDSDYGAELLAREDSMTARVPLAEGEVIAAVLNGSFDESPTESQFVAYRELLEADSPIYLTFIDYDEASRSYRRAWSGQTAATRPGTISLYTMDLLGDRSVCVLLSGVNGLGEHTLTIFRKNPFQAGGRISSGNELFTKIAEFRIDGTISVKEVERTQAYQMGFSHGQSYTISAYGRDFESSNIMDQVEIVYTHNAGNGLYEQTSITRIPGTQIEQRRLRELLGNPRAFEEFITGLWYYMTPQGSIDRRQYIYFDPPSREIIFYGDETQQVFNWQNSTATRYGLYVASQNISITTLRRSIDIELESLDSIRVKVFEDVRLNIKGVIAPWDGSYRKAGPPENQSNKIGPAGNTHINARYDGPVWKIQFLPSGTYELSAGGTIRQGKYAFYNLDDQELLELRSDGASGPMRETFLVEGELPSSTSGNDDGNSSTAEENIESDDSSALPEEDGGSSALRKTLALVRVRIGARGIENLYEGTISLTLAE